MEYPTIAVVEDDGGIAGLLSRALSSEGYRVVGLRTREEAEAEFAQSTPNLILLDLWLENREDGWDLAKGLKEQVRTAEIPIIICSADSVTLRDRASLLDEWGCTIVEKPFDLNILLDTIRLLLELPSS